MNPEDEIDFLRRYTSDVAGLLRQIDMGPVMAAISALFAAWQAGKVVLFCGNGGSGASCSHIVNDFQKNAGLKAICLNDSMPLVSAIANDVYWEAVFSDQVRLWGEQASVLIALSGSGQSGNTLRANLHAKSQGMTTIGLTGFDGGRLAQNVDISIHVATDSMQQAEDAHMVILHMLFLGLLRRIKEATRG